MLVSSRPTSDIFLRLSFYCTGFFKIKLQSRTQGMGHTPLVPPFPFPVLLYNGFLVQLSNFKVNIGRKREKDVEHIMLMLIQFSQVLLS